MGTCCSRPPEVLPTPRFVRLLTSTICNTKQKTTLSSFPGSWERFPLPISPLLPTRSRRRFPRAGTGLSDQPDAVAGGQDWETPCQMKVLRGFWLMPNQPRRCQTGLTGALPAWGELLQELPGQRRAQPGKLQEILELNPSLKLHLEIKKY